MNKIIRKLSEQAIQEIDIVYENNILNEELEKIDELEGQGFIWVLKQLYVGRVVEYHRPHYPDSILYVHIVRFREMCGWTLGTGIVVNNLGREHTISLEEIRL